MENQLPMNKVVLTITALRKKAISFGLSGVQTWLDDGKVDFVAIIDEECNPIASYHAMKNEICIPALQDMNTNGLKYIYISHFIQGSLTQSIQQPVDYWSKELNYKNMINL